jgi:2-polyprenyl-3-methyl-5-hydroxy-6-metoxy-1,4-benzoquinol methylase
MILHKLIIRFLKHKDDVGFYRIQAEDTVRWLEKVGVELDSGLTALDLGCGQGLIGGELMKRGCRVSLADENSWLLPEYADADFHEIDIEKDDLGRLGTYDLVISSNVLEHISDPRLLIDSIDGLLKPGGLYYLSWTNALSPWWGHEFAPLHYLGARRGARIFDRLSKRERKHTPFVDLFPYSITRILKTVRARPGLEVVAVVPRYYPEFSLLMRIPILREFAAWNCVILVERAR